MTLWIAFGLAVLASPPEAHAAPAVDESASSAQPASIVGAEISPPRPDLILRLPGPEIELKPGAPRYLPVGFQSAASRAADDTPDIAPNYIDGMNERRLRCDFHPRDLHETRPPHRPVMACGADETEREMMFDRARTELGE